MPQEFFNELSKYECPFICKSPSFSPRRFNVTLPLGWYFNKDTQKIEGGMEWILSLFHELAHFHHLLGTTYGVYYYIITFAQLIMSFIPLRYDVPKGKIKLPIKAGGLINIKGMCEGLLDYMEQSIDYRSIELTGEVISHKLELSSKNYEIFNKDNSKTGEIFSMPKVVYNALLRDGNKISIPVDANAIMENYAKLLEGVVYKSALKLTKDDIDKHYYYYFLTEYFFELVEIPVEIQFELLSCLYYISLMSITPIITNPDEAYFGFLSMPEGLDQLSTIKTLRSPGLIFYDALNAAIEIIKEGNGKINDMKSFSNQLCDKIKVPRIYELNRQLKRFIESYLITCKSASVTSIFPFVEYYSNMSLRFIDTILDNPFLFINGDITSDAISCLERASNGFEKKYPVPNVLIEYAYDDSGRAENYAFFGDRSLQQLYLEYCLDLYKQIFSNNKLYCYEIRHFSINSDANTHCKNAINCDTKKGNLDYKDCCKLYKEVFKMAFGDYHALA